MSAANARGWADVCMHFMLRNACSPKIPNISDVSEIERQCSHHKLVGSLRSMAYDLSGASSWGH